MLIIFSLTVYVNSTITHLSTDFENNCITFVNLLELSILILLEVCATLLFIGAQNSCCFT